MSNYIQSRINYTFGNEELVKLALRSAHREKDDRLVDDGNRGLAHYGVSAISMVETHNAIVESGRTLHELNRQNHWSKTKKGRATACRALGFEPFIKRSARQQHLSASETVLDNALSAIIGAIWLDCEDRQRTTADTRRAVWEVLRVIDAVLENAQFAPSKDGVLESVSNISSTMTGDSVEQPDMTDLVMEEERNDMETFTQDWFDRAFGGLPCGLLPNEGIVLKPQGLPIQAPVEAESTLLPEGCDADVLTELAMTSSTQDLTVWARSGANFNGVSNMSHYSISGRPIFHSPRTLRIVDSNATAPVTCPKRKRTQDSKERADSTYCSMLHSEQQKLECVSQDEKEVLVKHLEHPEISKLEEKSSNRLHFLYLAIGSWHTICDFRDQLRLARSNPSVHRQLCVSKWSAAETYTEICRLERVEALSILLRRYHTLVLCENEQECPNRCSPMVVETPHTIGVAGRSNAGNPISAQDASLTNQLLYKIMPGAQPGTNGFETARRRVKRLRKLAKYLRILVHSYGFGVLALLPSGPSFGEVSLTDNMLLSVTEAKFIRFSQLLFREQGPLLKSLSRFVEPSLLALVTCSLESGTVYQVEHLDLACLRCHPKGLLDLSQCPLVFEHHS